LVVNWRRQRRRYWHGEGHGERRYLVGRLQAVVTPTGQDCRRIARPIENAGKRDDWTERMGAKLKGRHYSKVAAAAAQRPEQVGL